MNSFALACSYPGFALDARAHWDSDRTALFGASGSGKTTLLEAIAGLRPEVTGTVTLRDRRVDALPARLRGLGWVPQDASLFPHMSARDNVEFGARTRGDREAAGVAVEALELEELLSRKATELSGGERQRVAIARALASRPEFLLLDEPLASVDRPLRARILPFLERIPERTGVPMLFVTHDPLEVLALARHVIVLEGGRVVAEGEPRSVFASAAGFGGLAALGAENVFSVDVISHGEGTLRLRTSEGCELEMAAVPGFPAPTRIAVRSEDVILAAERPRRISAQNVIEADVVGLDHAGAQVQVSLRAGGERWVVRVTQTACRQLELVQGGPVFLVIKAHAVHLHS